jgi:hypothetical protein
MSELNIMNAINAALSTLIAEHTKPLVERISCLENDLLENERRIRDLEVVKNSFELSLVDALTMCAKNDKRTSELVARVDTDVQALSHRIARVESNVMNVETKLEDKQSIYEPGVLDVQQLCAALKDDAVISTLWETLEDRVQGVASAEAAEAVSDHTCEYNHDNFVSDIDSEAVRDAVNDALSDAEIRIRV